MSDKNRTPSTPPPSAPVSPPASPVDGLTAPIAPKARMSVFQRFARLIRR